MGFEIAELRSWTEMDDPSAAAFSGVARYRTAFKKPDGKHVYWVLDLGDVRESASVKLNGKNIATLLQPPFHVILKDEELGETNQLEVAVANLMVNRMLEIDSDDSSWKKFYNINFPAKNRQNRGADGLFTTRNWKPIASGLLGPVTLTPIRSLAPNSGTGIKNSVIGIP